MKYIIAALAVCCATCISAARVHAQLTVLHPFANGNDGAGAFSSLIQSGSTLYGVTYVGGSGTRGAVFRIGTDGSGYSLLHSFTGSANDGAGPAGSLILSGSTLYGASQSIYAGGQGSIFKVNTDGTGFASVYAFGGATPAIPTLSHLSGSVLYGTIGAGGSNGSGKIFRINTSGTGFTVLHTFAGGYGGPGPDPFPGDHNDGADPFSPLMQSGSTFYGTTIAGGSTGAGTVYKINVDGTGFALQNSFVNNHVLPSPDGYNPLGSVLSQSGTTIYGATMAGGDFGGGVIYKIETDGTGFTVLHSFGSDPGDGIGTVGSLVQSGNTLYGMTPGTGASSNLGTIFQIGTDGTGYQILHTFTGGVDGSKPGGGLIMSGSTLYGLTTERGTGGWGTLFSLVVPEPSTLTLAIISAALMLCRRKRRG